MSAMPLPHLFAELPEPLAAVYDPLLVRIDYRYVGRRASLKAASGYPKHFRGAR